MNTIRLQLKRSSIIGSVPHPWEVLYEFGRMLCLGMVVTFGARPAHQPKPAPSVKMRRHPSFADSHSIGRAYSSVSPSSLWLVRARHGLRTLLVAALLTIPVSHLTDRTPFIEGPVSR